MAEKDGHTAMVWRENESQRQSCRNTVHHIIWWRCILRLLSSEPLTVRPVTVFHSGEVFTLYCSTSVCPFHHSEPRRKV